MLEDYEYIDSLSLRRIKKEKHKRELFDEKEKIRIAQMILSEEENIEWKNL
jgi:hypothetical protein